MFPSKRESHQPRRQFSKHCSVNVKRVSLEIHLFCPSAKRQGTPAGLLCVSAIKPNGSTT
jgi:hypothetical protein